MEMWPNDIRWTQILLPLRSWVPCGGASELCVDFQGVGRWSQCPLRSQALPTFLRVSPAVAPGLGGVESDNLAVKGKLEQGRGEG